jgi:hypothetical protein
VSVLGTDVLCEELILESRALGGPNGTDRFEAERMQVTVLSSLKDLDMPHLSKLRHSISNVASNVLRLTAVAHSTTRLRDEVVFHWLTETDAAVREGCLALSHGRVRPGLDATDATPIAPRG